jgi:hypothetical protein
MIDFGIYLRSRVMRAIQIAWMFIWERAYVIRDLIDSGFGRQPTILFMVGPMF